MLSSLQIQNFRALKDVKIKKLGRVNLIVGENNSGKSSVLEALRIYASGGNPYVLNDILKSHHEGVLIKKYDENKSEFNHEQDIFSSFFYQRKYPENHEENIKIGEDDNGLELFYENNFFSLLKVYHKGHLINNIASNIYLDRGLSLFSLLNKNASILSFKYISTQFIENQELPIYWDKIILTNYENEVIKSLQIIEPNIEKLAFINKSAISEYRIPMVGLKNSDTPIPLYSMGDGMKRILQLILNLHQAKDGLLLIDEFDNGLHYKVQEKVWSLLFELAERFNVQVFATTHSNDCIRAFSKISQERTDIEGILIQMTKEQYKDGTSQITANTVDESQLQRLLNLGVDVR